MARLKAEMMMMMIVRALLYNVMHKLSMIIIVIKWIKNKQKHSNKLNSTFIIKVTRGVNTSRIICKGIIYLGKFFVYNVILNTIVLADCTLYCLYYLKHIFIST